MRADDVELAATVMGRILLGQRLKLFVEIQEPFPVLVCEPKVLDVVHEGVVLAVPLRSFTARRRAVGRPVERERQFGTDHVEARASEGVRPAEGQEEADRAAVDRRDELHVPVRRNRAVVRGGKLEVPVEGAKSGVGGRFVGGRAPVEGPGGGVEDRHEVRQHQFSARFQLGAHGLN